MASSSSSGAIRDAAHAETLGDFGVVHLGERRRRSGLVVVEVLEHLDPAVGAVVEVDEGHRQLQAPDGLQFGAAMPNEPSPQRQTTVSCGRAIFAPTTAGIA